LSIWQELGLEPPSEGADNNPPSSQLTADDFAALGYAFLQLQLLTRRLRYSNTLDESAFAERVISAAAAFISKDEPTAKEQLHAAFDLLLAERNRYYPVEAQLVELVLLDREHPPHNIAASTRKLNLLLPLDVARHLQVEQPELVEQLAVGAQSGKHQILGSTENTLPESLLSTAALLNEYVAGKQTYEELFGIAPSVFGRRRGNLHPAQPQILSSLGYRGALHLPLSPDQKLPPAAAATLGWQGLGQHSLDAISATPLDANSPNAFLGLALDIGQQIDSAHQATMVLVHWPDQTCEPFEDLTRVARHSSLLGRFVTCDELFDTLYHPGYGDRFDYDDYRSNSLAQFDSESRVNPISTAIALHAVQAQWLALRHLNTMLATMNPKAAEINERLQKLLPDLKELATPPLRPEAETRKLRIEKFNQSLAELRSGLSEAAAQTIFRSGRKEEHNSTSSIALLNPSFSPRRVRQGFSHSNAKSPPLAAPPVVLADANDQSAAVVSDVPASGFVILTSSGGAPQRRQPPMVVDQTLRNEFFELEIDQRTGGIRRLRTHGARTTLLSQQLAILVDPTRESEDEPLSGFARMQAEKVSFDSSQPLTANCQSEGNLVFGEETWARFRQQISINRGIRTIEFDVEIELLRELDGRPWQQYVCSRLAWGDEPLGRYRGLHDTHQPVRLEKFLAPSYLHVDNGHTPLTFFSDGLAYHRQSQLRVLDSLLIVRGESARRFRFAVGVGIETPHLTASQRHSDCLAIPLEANTPSQQRFFHLASKNLLVVDSAPTFTPTGNCNGAILRFRESVGASGQAALYAPVKLKGAKLLDLSGKPLEALPVTDDRVTLEYHGYKLFTLQLFW
jgi:alpha-mannosidase